MATYSDLSVASVQRVIAKAAPRNVFANSIGKTIKLFDFETDFVNSTVSHESFSVVYF